MNTKKVEAEDVKELIDSVDTFLVDCDGVIWEGDNPIPGAVSTIAKLKALNKKIIYVSNNSSKSVETYMSKFEKLGFVVKENEVFTPSYCAAKYLADKNFDKSAYVIGSQGIIDELNVAGIKHLGIGPDPLNFRNPEDDVHVWLKNDLHLEENVGAVILGFDPQISLPKYTKATSYLTDPDCHFILTNEDHIFPVSSSMVLPGTGSLMLPVINASERKPMVLGKPHRYMFDLIKSRHNIDPSRTMMIGDNLFTDIAFGHNNDMLIKMLVLSGVCQLSHLEKITSNKAEGYEKYVPSHYISSLADLGEF